MTLGPPLTEQEVAELPDGTEVEITWSGGNGPHRYYIRQEPPYGTYWQPTFEDEATYQRARLHRDAIRFVGVGPPFTVIRVVEKERGVTPNHGIEGDTT